MTEYRTHDKSTWGDGPWQDEPDKMQWVDDATDLDCLIVRNGGGALCGYVGVPPEHPWHGVGYSECFRGSDCDTDPDDYWCENRPDAATEVHGGLTFADSCHDTGDPSKGICHIPEPGRPDDVWWFGFDCAHAYDLCPASDARLRESGFDPRRYEVGETYKDVAYVKREIANLAQQLAAVVDKQPA